MRVLKWVFLALYICIVLGLFGFSYSGKIDWFLLGILKGNLSWTIFLLAIAVVSQLIFLFGAGTIELCRPIRRRRLIAPVIIASLMMAILVAVLCLSLAELIKVESENWVSYILWIIFGFNWLIWGFFFFIYSQGVERYRTLRKFVTIILAGSLVELLAVVPSHIVVSRRPGCFVGLCTAWGIIGGMYVMLWAFGPGVILLFLREKRRIELKESKKPRKIATY